MFATFARLLLLVPIALCLASCGDEATLPVAAGTGPHPALPPPVQTFLPTVVLARAKGWPDGVTPKPAAGLSVKAFATGLDHPRWLYVLPNGDVLVAESDAPPQPGIGGISGWLMKMGMRWTGAAAPSANRITLLRDADGDGEAETKTAFLTGLNSPIGMALIGKDFYAANTDSVIRFPYEDGATAITAPGEKIADLPAGPVNLHWVKNIVASSDGKHLYVGVGSNSNLGENGMENEEDRAAIHEIYLATGTSRIFASGLRNPVGLAFQPDSGALWTTVNERDELGSDLVPDYKKDSTAGLIAITASISILVSSRSGQTSSPTPSCRTTRSARIPHRSASPSTTARCFPSIIVAAPLSASTARGTASRRAVTR
jgi:glucose/arabinose dehydrogenase